MRVTGLLTKEPTFQQLGYFVGACFSYANKKHFLCSCIKY